MRAPVHDLHVSNLVSYASLASAVSAVMAAAGGHRHAAAMGLALSALADTFDGKFARLFTRTARQSLAGHELDSLVDAAAFGLAPVAVLAALTPRGDLVADLIWATAASAYVVAVVTRLGYYNLAKDEDAFVGIPTPAAALLWATVLLTPPTLAGTVTMFFATAAAMVAPIPLPRPRGVGLFLFAGWALVVASLHLRM